MTTPEKEGSSRDPRVGESDEQWWRRMRRAVLIERLRNFPTTPEALEEEYRKLPPEDKELLTEEKINRMVNYAMGRGPGAANHDADDDLDEGAPGASTPDR